MDSPTDRVLRDLDELLGALGDQHQCDCGRWHGIDLAVPLARVRCACGAEWEIENRPR